MPALVDPRIAKLGGTRRNPKSNYEFPEMMRAEDWARTRLHKSKPSYSCAHCGQGFAGPHAVYSHLAAQHGK